MLFQGEYRNEVLVWRLIGAGIWSLLGFSVIAHIWSLKEADFRAISLLSIFRQTVLNFSAWWNLINIATANSIAFAVHSSIISTEERNKDQSFNIIGSSTVFLPFLSSTFVRRASSLPEVLRWLAYFAAHAASAHLHYVFLHDKGSWRIDGEMRNSTLLQRISGTECLLPPRLRAGARWQLVLCVFLSAIHTSYVMHW